MLPFFQVRIAFSSALGIDSSCFSQGASSSFDCAETRHCTISPELLVFVRVARCMAAFQTLCCKEMAPAKCYLATITALLPALNNWLYLSRNLWFLLKPCASFLLEVRCRTLNNVVLPQRSFTSLAFITFLLVCARSRMCGCACGHQRSTLGVFLNYSAPALSPSPLPNPEPLTELYSTLIWLE